MPDVPSAVGCTGVAYSLGYSAFWSSTAWRSVSFASVSGTVLIHVIDSPEKQDIDRNADCDDRDSRCGLEGIVSAEQHQQEQHQYQEDDRRGRGSPGAIRSVGRAAPNAEQAGHRETDKEYRHKHKIGDDLTECP